MSEMTDDLSFNSDELNTSCVFINTNNPKVQDRVQKNNIPCPLIKPSFPPLIDPKDLLIIGKDNKPSRSPNAFIIYRKVFFKTIRNEGHVLPMTAISSMASQSWEQEPDEVKKYYKRLAKEAYNYRNECFPKKVNRRKKRERWNIVSFNNNLSISSSSSPTVNNQNVSENTTENLQLLTPTEENPLIDTFMQLNNALLQKIMMSNEFSLNILSNFKNQNDTQCNNSNDFFNDASAAELLDLQEQIYQNPSMDDKNDLVSPNFNHYNNQNDILSDNCFQDAAAVELLNLQEQQIFPSPSLSLDDMNDLVSPDLNELINPFPIENSQQLGNDEPIEQEEIQQFITDDLQQQLLFPQSLTTDDNDLTDLNSFDDLNVFSNQSLSDYLDDLSNNDATIDLLNSTNTEVFLENSNPLQCQDGLGISTFANAEFENLFSL